MEDVVLLVFICVVSQITKNAFYVFGVRPARIYVFRTPGTPQTLQFALSDFESRIKEWEVAALRRRLQRLSFLKHCRDASYR